MIRKLWNDNNGGIISTELVMVASLVTAGILGGVAQFSGKVSQEFSDLGTVVANTSNVNSGLIQNLDSKIEPQPSVGMEFSRLSDFVAGDFLDTSED